MRKPAADELVGHDRTERQRCPAWVYGETDGQTWSRIADIQDADIQDKIDAVPLPGSVPVMPIPWGDLYRAGYHEGMSHLHHFYTRRNFLAFSALREATRRYPRKILAALRFCLLSYNAAHSTIMTRVVAKKGQGLRFAVER